MPSFSTKALASILAILGTANAHMIMSSPVPFGKSTLNNSPLAGDGSDFPCKQRAGVYDPEGASNVMAIGEPQTLSFIGSAVHGGGSCQVSLTNDPAPSKDTKWMVIKSIEGGCPADVAGNLPADASGTGAATFQYTVPEGITPGDYTIAWSWVNKIGNREFYMNCGPATITAAKKKRYAPTPKQSPNKRQASFPDMFVANLAGVSNGCTTPDSKDIIYPDPGADVQKSTDGTFADPVGCSGGAAPVAAGSASAAASAPASTGESSNTVAPIASSASAVAPSAVASQPSVSPGVFATGAASQSAVAPAATETATVSPLPVTSAAASAASPSASGTSSTSPASTVGTESGACDQEGEWSCSADGTSFQRCASGQWSTPMAMAAGTTCTPGVSSSISMKTVNVGRRDLKSHLKHRRVAHSPFLS